MKFVFLSVHAQCHCSICIGETNEYMTAAGSSTQAYTLASKLS